MTYVRGYAEVTVWVPDGEPGEPGQGLPPGYPGRPGQGLPWPGRPPVDPGWGVEGGAPGQGLPGRPGRPGQGLPWPGRPVDPDFGWGGWERPGHGLPWPGRPVDPGWGVEGGEPGGGPVYPGRPGQGLPRPPRPDRGPYPAVPLPDDIGPHPEPLPDLNAPGMWAWIQPAKQRLWFPAFIVNPDQGGLPEEHEVRHPEHGLPGAWLTVLGPGGQLAWAWAPDAAGEEVEPEE
jgi:hypothetical protein